MHHVLMCSGPLKQADVLKEHKEKPWCYKIQKWHITVCVTCQMVCALSRHAKAKNLNRALTENIQTYDLLPELLQQ